MRHRILNAALVAMLPFLLLQTAPARAQSQAAMQVCADILAQYGIAPEGCDPHDEVSYPQKEEPKTVVAESFAPDDKTRQELDENNVFFRSGGDKLDRIALQKIDLLGQVLNTSILRNACLRLVGHSDSSGPPNLNQQMGQKRAQMVAQYLGPRLNDPGRILEIRSDGETNLIPSLNSENALHRRVTIYAKKCPRP